MKTVYGILKLMSQKGFVSLLILLAILISLGIAGGFYYSALKVHTKIANDIPVSIPNPTSNQNADNVSFQKRNNALDNYIEYQIPRGWKRYNTNQHVINPDNDPHDYIMLVTGDFHINEGGYMDKGKAITVNRSLKKSNETVYDRMKKTVFLNVYENEKDKYLKDIIQDVTIGGIQGLSGFDDYEGNHLYYLIEKDNYMWTFLVNMDKTVDKNTHDPDVDSFLSSVKFR